MGLNPHAPNSPTMTPPNRADHPPRKIGDHDSPMADIAAKTNSAGGSKWQKPASKQAADIGNSWMASPAHRYAHEAVVWSQSGQRHSGTFVSPARDPKTGESGIRLHSLNTGSTFHADSEVGEVHFVEKPGMPSSSERQDMYDKEQAARKQTVE